MSNEWIPIDKASINYQTRYEVTYNGGKVEVVEGHDIYRDQCTAIRLYEPTPYVAPAPIKAGDGWRLLAEKEPKRKGDEYLDPQWKNDNWRDIIDNGIKTKGFYYRRRIEPNYRPFANAAEYAPHRDRWLKHKMRPSERCKLSSYDDESPWQLFFDRYVFEDTEMPFGVEATK